MSGSLRLLVRVQCYFFCLDETLKEEPNRCRDKTLCLVRDAKSKPNGKWEHSFTTDSLGSHSCILAFIKVSLHFYAFDTLLPLMNARSK